MKSGCCAGPNPLAFCDDCLAYWLHVKVREICPENCYLCATLSVPKAVCSVCSLEYPGKHWVPEHGSQNEQGEYLQCYGVER